GGPDNEDREIQHRLMMRTLLEDGEFARLFLSGVVAGKLAKIEECLKAAVAAGEAIAAPVQPRLASWFFEHLAVVIMTRLRPDAQIMDYGVSRKQLVEQAVWFTLRGMGLSDAAIRRHYNPKALNLLEP